ncbi:hypothetical protein LCGC14_2936730 [marine sediment metagenome]|uniref:Uncharacterized protein n=1 Tax=marine sediment metagenome TaxID=412755 RepID=A0A0F8XJT9_9ZZZZ
MTPPPSREPAPVTDAEAEKEIARSETTHLGGAFGPRAALRLLRDRADYKERIGELEGRLGPRSRAIHNRFAETEEHSGWWEACQVPPCRDDRTLLGEAQDE